MLLHRIKPNFNNPNTSTNNISKTFDDDLAIINYQTKYAYSHINYTKPQVNNNNINKNIVENDITLIEEDGFITKSMVRSFNPEWKPLNKAGIYAIAFYRDSSNNAVPIFKYSNAYAFLPISNNLIYAATIFMQYNTAYTQGNIFSVTRNDLNPLNSAFVFNYETRGIVGQGVDPPNNTINLEINDNSNKIYAIARDASNNIYIGGSFYINNGTLNGIKGFAKWDISGNTWSSFRGSDGIEFNLQTGGTVYSIVVVNQNNIYVAGYFGYIDENNPIGSATSSFVRWDGTKWIRNLLTLTDANVSIPASVYAMKFSSNNLYIGGSITFAKVPSNSNFFLVNNIFRFNTISIDISRLGDKGGGSNGPVYALDVDPSGNALYIGGSFGSVYRSFPSSTLIVNNLARWNIKTQTGYSANTWSTIQYSTIANINDSNVKNNTNGNVGVPNVVYAVAVNPRTPKIVLVGGIFQSTTGNNRIVSRASDFISSFNIDNNRKTNLWTKVDYGLIPNGS